MCDSKAKPLRELGPHVTVEELQPGEDESLNGDRGVQIIINVPFELKSMAEAELDICSKSLVLTGPSSIGSPKVKVPLPEDIELDADRAAAKFSKKKKQLTITAPNVAKVGSQQGAPAKAVSSTTSNKSKNEQSAEKTFDPPPRGQPDPKPASQEDDDDDDDDIPCLEATRSRPTPSAEAIAEAEAAAEKAAERSAAIQSGDLKDLGETNEAADLMMQKALAAREQKKKEAEESRRSADMASGGGLKKGFFSNAKASKKSKEQPKKKEEDIPFITGAGDAEARRRASLEMPEVQQAIREGTRKLKDDSSWVTPQLMTAMQARPDLLKALADPKIKEAMALMQENPDLAKQKYANDPEVTTFLKDFSGLMATHFNVLSQEAGKSDSKTETKASPAQAPIKAPPVPAPGTTGEFTSQGLPIADPAVAAAFQDPEVQQLIGALRQGMPLEMHELMRHRPHLFQKLKILLDNGLLSLQQ